MIQPKISVVTVCYNAINDIEKTILSVINQTYSNIEYIIIDGGSTDGTMDIVNKYKDKIDVIVSEPDKGIYDAMNKGIDRATGDWINFMNAGDCFFNNVALENVFPRNYESVNFDILYGYQVHSFPYGKFVRKRLPLKDFDSYMPIGHPASFVRAELLKKEHFDCSFRIAADYNFFFKAYKSGKKFKALDVIISDFESAGGVSSLATFKTIKESAIVNGSYGSLNYWWIFLKLKFISYIREFLQIVFPKSVDKIKECKRNNNSEYIPLNKFDV